MNILGISCYFHDAAAALLQDGDGEGVAALIGKRGRGGGDVGRVRERVADGGFEHAGTVTVKNEYRVGTAEHGVVEKRFESSEPFRDARTTKIERVRDGAERRLRRRMVVHGPGSTPMRRIATRRRSARASDRHDL